MKVSRLTFLYAIAVILSASFMRQILTMLQQNLTPKQLEYFVWGIFLVCIFPLVYFVYKLLVSQKRMGNIIELLSCLGAGIYYASTLQVVEERFHLVLFGILGFLVARDNCRKTGFRIIFLCIGFSAMVAGIDEAFQHILPNRVGDLRDVLFGTIGGIWGIAIYFSIFTGSRFNLDRRGRTEEC